MKESTLLRIALSFSLVGLAALFIIAHTSEVKETPLSNISGAAAESIVKVRGVVSGIQDNGKTARIDIASPKTTEVFLFKSHNLSIKRGDFVEITGEVSEYNGRKEIVASDVEVLT